MATLRAGNLANGVDDRTDTSPQYNTNTSRATYFTAFAYNPVDLFVLAPGCDHWQLGASSGGDADIPSEQAGVWAWLGD